MDTNVALESDYIDLNITFEVEEPNIIEEIPRDDGTIGLIFDYHLAVCAASAALRKYKNTKNSNISAVLDAWEEYERLDNHAHTLYTKHKELLGLP